MQNGRLAALNTMVNRKFVTVGPTQLAKQEASESEWLGLRLRSDHRGSMLDERYPYIRLACSIK